MAPDEEQGTVGVHYITGFGALASLIASDVDHTTAVYKRFDKLAARDLLHYECELLELEARQDQYDREDALDAEKQDSTDDMPMRIRINARDWASFKHAAADDAKASGDNAARWKKRMDLAMEIRSTLKEYREALVLNSTLLTLHPPSKQTLTALSNCFHQTDGSAVTPTTTSPTLLGPGSTVYPVPDTPASQQPTDLVSLAPPTHTDPLTYLLKTYCSWLFQSRGAPVPAYHRTTAAASPVITPLHPPQLRAYSLPLLSLTVSLLTTLLAAMLLFLPIYILYRTPGSQPDVRLGLIALFTILFAGVVALVTNARRAEVFASCAAYAAVLVVFISGDLGGGGGGGSR